MKLKVAIAQGFLASLCTIATAAWACPPSVAAMKSKYLPKGATLCQLQDRYQKALAEMSKKGVAKPERVANLMGPRFINLPDWLRDRAAKNYDPYLVYTPIPKTWKNWEAGADIMQKFESENFRTSRLRPLQLEDLKVVHVATYQGLGKNAGKFRDHLEVGRSLARDTAVLYEQAQTLTNEQYINIFNPRKDMVTWHPTQCIQDRTEAFQKDFVAQNAKNPVFHTRDWPEQKTNSFFIAEDGKKKQCGYMEYLEPGDVLRQLQLWMYFTNATVSAINHNAAFLLDPVWAASRIQRWFIAIHPFSDGNGRMSRFVMEYVFRSVGLPSPLIKDFNDDLYSTEKQWSVEIGQGLVRAVEVAETCAKDPSSPGCNVVDDPATR